MKWRDPHGDSDIPVSVILPVRDGGSFLSQALESLCRQTHRTFEVVVVDDGSKDDSARVAGEMAARDERFRVVQNRFLPGLIGALQTGWTESRHALVARLDADDRAHPERLARQVAVMESEPDLAGCGTAVTIIRRETDADPPREAQGGFRRYADWLAGLVTPELLARDRFIESPLVHPSVLLRRSAVEAVGGYRDPPGGWAEDYDLWLRLLDAGHRLRNLPEAMVEWTDRNQRLTRTDPRYAFRRFLAAKAHFLARLPLVRDRGVVVCGAGPIGRGQAKALHAENVRVRAFFDIDPAKVGRQRGGVPVLDGKLFGNSEREAVALGAVGSPGGRERVRALASEAGYTEGLDFWACC